MATAGLEKKVKDNFLTCSICFEMYTDPCTLKCDHTFCRKCVTSYIQTRPDAVQSKTIPCPCCRQDTKVPYPSSPVEEWAGQIKPSIIIQGLIDAYRSEVAVPGTSSTCCMICQQLGETTPGVLWCPECEVVLCDKCVKIHRVTPISLNHDLCDLSSKSKVKRRIKCTEHKSNHVEFHCQDCGKAACQTCCIIYHRACKTVVTIESMKPGMKAALMEKRLGMEKRLKVRSKKVDIRNEKLQSNSRITESAVQNIRLICQTAINKIKQKETQLLDELNNISQTYADQLQADVKLEEIEMQMYRQHCEFIDQALLSDCEMDLYDAYHAWESGAVEMEDVRDTEAADIRRIDDIRFTPDTDNVLKVLDNLQLGEIDVTYQHQEQCLPSPVLVDRIDGRVAGDEEDPYLQDVTVLVVDGVQACVVTDYNNNCVKSFFTRKNHSCHSKLPLETSPKGMTQSNEKQVMFAVPESLQILRIEVTPDLVLLSAITTRSGYYSLAILNPSCLAAGTWDCVDILDIAGHVLRSITTYNGDSLFSDPWFMCVNNKGNLLVSDWGKKSVTCLTSEGDVVWIYAPTGDRTHTIPRGITTTSTGDILLVDSDMYKVIQLTEAGEFARELLTLEDGYTKVPHPSRPVEEWAGQIKASIVIQGLIDTYWFEEDVQGKRPRACCTICQQLGETTPAALWCPECQVVLCDKCVKIHRVTPNSLNHDLCDLSSRSKVKRRIKCTEHKSNRVEFHCQDCGKAACQTCCIIYHRACKAVVTIESMKPGLKAALMERRLGMEKRLTVRSKKVDIRNEKLQSNSRITESAVQNIRLICQTAINKIKQKETQLLDELNNISQTYAGQLQADVKLEEIEMQMYRQHCEFIDQALVSDCEMDLYDAYQAWESGAVEMEDITCSLGTSTSHTRDTCLSTPVLVDTRDGRVVDDEKPNLCDMIVLVVDGVQTCVVTDFKNMCVKSFFTRNNHSCHSKLPLDNTPNGITQLNEKQVMVAVPLSRQIVTVDVIPDLVLLSTIKTRAEYYSLAVLNPSCLAASSNDCVDILDMSGHVLKSITTHNDDSLFARPWYMCVNNKGNLLVSDCEKRSVTCLTSEGDVLWRYNRTGDKALGQPFGITTTSTGDILFVEWNTDKVIQLTESGEFVRELLTLEDGDQTGMRDIFCDKYGFLFLCTDTEVKEYMFV
ncbi:uncharacterized protein LOC124279581 [Haliotis rubra]|uniref:uncharacterized protein LOC124279581 n=1 Tax=Haliotis rubra TaxID=36100 RepID=UPI001EE57E4A|nr:uncharacterized protein LOC124279581 [Haliotis rubra]